jgi:tripartite-type tricarboxylate transporter receptor subunit TctC
MEHVPHKGSATALVEVIGGRVDVQFENLAATMAHIRAGTLRVVAVLSNRRLPIARDVATMDELGFPNLDVDTWGGIMVPAGTPPHVVASLNKMLNTALMVHRAAAGLH